MKRRIIVDTDAKNEADDQFAIVQALLSPTLDVVGIIPAHFGTRRTRDSMLESRREVDLLLEFLDLGDAVPVANGSPFALVDDVTPAQSDGARLIIREARKPGPLFVTFLGPLTDMASALLIDPSIANNPDLTVVWIGGGPYDGSHGGEIRGEFNASNDVAAANLVLASGVRVWQIPWTVYSMVSVGYAELDERVAPYGPLGEYLVRQLKQWNTENVEWDRECHSLGDSPAIGVVLNPAGAVWRHHPVRLFDRDGRLTNLVVEGRTVKVADSVDVRYLLEDMFAKMKAHVHLPAAENRELSLRSLAG